MRKLQLIIFFVFTGFISLSFLVPRTHAATLINFKDRISTSRPSPSTTVTGTFTGGVTIADNKSRFLASDSAQLVVEGTGAVSETKVVSSQSAALTSLYFTAALSGALTSDTHYVRSAVTAMHTLKFTTVTGIPINGKIILTFPGSTDNTASPSASTFAFNNISSSQIVTNNATCSWSISSPTMTCTVSGAISPGTEVSIILGCTAQSSGECTTSAPRLINPTKSAVAGTADLWRLNIETQDASSNTLDTGKASIGTVDAVRVRAEVDPTLTFIISGVADATALSGVATGCSDTTNSGNASTATDVNLGFLSSGTVTLAAQRLAVSTNASGGYVISSTSSGKFINPASGYFLASLNDSSGESALTANDTPAPGQFGSSGSEGFGISACGPRVNTTLWGTGATGFSTGPNYSNPYNSSTNSYYATIASFTGTTGVSNDYTVVKYGATISGTTPAGIYSNYFTYIATAAF